jgi:hypothetical protein
MSHKKGSIIVMLMVLTAWMILEHGWIFLVVVPLLLAAGVSWLYLNYATAIICLALALIAFNYHFAAVTIQLRKDFIQHENERKLGGKEY